MTASEKEYFEAVPANEFNTYWVPCTWFIFRLQEASKQGKLLNQYALESIMRVGGGDLYCAGQNFIMIKLTIMCSSICSCILNFSNLSLV